MSQLLSLVDLDDVVKQIRDSLLLHRARGGAVKLVIESDVGEEIHVLQTDPSSTTARRMTPATELVLHPHPSPATSPLLTDELVGIGNDHYHERKHADQQELLQRCNQQQQRIAELEQRLQQVQQELYHQPRSLSLVVPAADRAPLSCQSTDDDSNDGSRSSDSPHHSSDIDTVEDGC